MDFNLNRLWAAVQTDLRLRLGDYLLPAAAFYFLPSLAVSLLVNVPPDAELLDNPAIRWGGLTNIVAVMGTLAITIKSLSPEVPTGMAIRRAGKLFPAAFILALLSGIATIIGIFALIVPGLIIAARLWLVIPVLIEERGRTIDIMKRSWAMTDGHTLKILGLFAMLMIVVLLAGMPVVALSALDGILGLGDPKIGDAGLLEAIAAGVVASGTGILAAVFAAKAYEMLVGRPIADTFS
ncbi:glycerophosphoryl diester phosphodiesterase membrane domain-containing protein [Pacificimonas sp. WHA3]|uniref:Glycerophosphoryl diester phosphodiesterase membrane domain-containing protein n=1 Tax=Pacificimonas pallii TaxID=2827236 RepID=A0ABS6SH68_9SPHN|nr:glycerophosphoryl diester phosphodiesterase membrane domain-containing protein [Pacificimonas pallii]MBV7257764.1 glycerophosphoryl diester phosphodiesterase membrane domain-containing protein [Pacificimonas pallii]